MANRATTSSVVRVNSKIENIDVLRLPAPADGTLIAEGKLVSWSASAEAAQLAGTSDNAVFINWVDSDRSDVRSIQMAPMADLDHDYGQIQIETGGLACLIGQGNLIGLPFSLWTAEPDVGDFVICGGSGVIEGKTAVAIGGAAAEAADTRTFGVVVKKEGNIAWFLFTSIATLYDMAGT